MKNNKSVLDLADEAEDYGLRILFIALEPEERPEKLAEFFLLASGRGKDEVALKFYKFLQQSFLDIEAAPRVEETEGVTVYTHNERGVMRSRANSACTLKTMDLYGKIAGFKKLKTGKFIRDEKWVAPKEATLLKTKEEMLKQVASKWHYSSDDQEADECFLFLVAAFEFASQYKEEKLFEEVLLDATPDYFPQSRLVRHHQLLLSLGPFQWGANHKVKKIAKILAHAWVNGTDFQERARAFGVFLPIFEIPRVNYNRPYPDNNATLDFLRQTSEKIAEFHLAINELIAFMKSRDAEQVPGNFRISYHSTEWAAVRIVVEINPGYYRSTRREVNEDGHKWFELARDYVVKWQEQHRQYKVDLELVAKMQHNDTLIFERKQTIG